MILRVLLHPRLLGRGQFGGDPGEQYALGFAGLRLIGGELLVHVGVMVLRVQILNLLAQFLHPFLHLLEAGGEV